jgi:hypothetical protein
MTDSTTSTHSQPKKPSLRPTVWRLLASKYVDVMICGFIAWIVVYSLGWQTYWLSLTLFLWVGEFMWFRDRLRPTAGEFCLGIRYLTSSSSHVVTEIQVIHPKLKLNGFLLFSGVVEMTLAILFFCGWTFIQKAVVWGITVEGLFTFAYWLALGMAFFLCGGGLLSGTKNALWVVPAVHLVFLADLFKSLPTWKMLWGTSSFPNWMSVLVKTSPFFGMEWIFLWTLFLLAVVFLSRRHLVN